MTPKTLRRETYKKELTNLLEKNPEAHKVRERYRVMMYLLSKEWTNLIGSVEKETMKAFLQDVIYTDRKIRLETEGEEDETKEVLSQEYQIKELGVEVGHQQDLKKLDTLSEDFINKI
jgi:ornithine carbamoyltransferase